MVQSSGRFKTTHTGCNLSAKAYGEVRRFETTLYRALFRGQSKKRHRHAHQSVSFTYNPEAPFGLEAFDPELTTEGLMAERKGRGHVLR
jgi:hypothetical protein